ncbi:unnamed protein product [Malus baccata var. baccata]
MSMTASLKVKIIKHFADLLAAEGAPLEYGLPEEYNPIRRMNISPVSSWDELQQLLLEQEEKIHLDEQRSTAIRQPIQLPPPRIISPTPQRIISPPSSFAGNIISFAPPGINNNNSDHLFPSHGCREENHAVGIDLGTTHSRVALWHKDHLTEIILNDQGNRMTPSYVAFSETDERLVGDQAFNQVVRNSANLIYGT